MLKMLYNRCTGIYKFGNNTYPQRIRRRSNFGHIFQGKKCFLWAGKYGIYIVTSITSYFVTSQVPCQKWKPQLMHTLYITPQ